MKTAKLLLLLTLFLRAEIAFNQELKVISYNIRFNNPADGLNCWDLRKDEMWSKFEVSSSNTLIFVLNTHFDHHGRASREQANFE